MIPEKYFRYACLITAFANAAGNLGLMLFYRPVMEMLGAPLPKDLHYFFWMSGLSFTNGVLAYYVFVNPDRNRDLLKVGIVGKGIFSIMTFYFYIHLGIHWFFLLFGAWDGVFTLIFFLYLLKLQAKDLTSMNGGKLLPGMGLKTGKAVVIYYSMTGTGGGAVGRLKQGLESRGYHTDMIQLSAVEKDIFHFPFDSALDFFKIAIRAIIRRPAKIEPISLPSDHDYDLIVVESQTWFVGMSALVEALFQDESNRPFFKGRDAVVLVVCRGLWRRSQAMVVNHLERYGANIIGTRAYTHEGREPSRLFSLLAYLIYGQTGRPAWLSWFLQPHYGLGESSLAEIEEYGRALAERKLQGAADGDN